MLHEHLHQKRKSKIPKKYNNIHTGKGGVYAALPLPCEGMEAISDRPSAQVKHIKKSNT